MAATTAGRRNRRALTGGISKVRAKKAALLGATAVTATAMVAGVSTPAGALTLDATTTGPLLRIADALGLKTVTVPNVPVVGDITVNFKYAANDPVTLADAINAYPFGGFNVLGYDFRRQPGGVLGSAILAGSGMGAFNAGTAYEALLSSAGGNTLPGYTPLAPSGFVDITGTPCTEGLTCTQGTNTTNLAVVQLNNPGTPNGGLFARFQPILDLFGVDGVSAGGASNSSTGIALNAATIGVGLGYSVMSDFPVTLNPFSLLNSVLASVLPTNLLGGITVQGASAEELEAKLALLAAAGTVSTSYGTIVPDDLSLLEPLRLPVRLINLLATALGFELNLPTPIADALQPAAEILVNIGYTDVITPDELDDCAKACDDPDPTKHQTYADLGYSAYDRSYLDSGVYTPFLSQSPLTPEQWLAVPGDVIGALIGGIFNVPSSGAAVKPPAATPPSTAARAASAVAAAPEVAAEASPVSAPTEVPRLSAPRKTVRPAAATGQSSQPRGGAAVRQSAGKAADAAPAAATPKRAAATRG